MQKTEQTKKPLVKKAKLNKNSKLYKTIVQAITDKKAEHIVSLDLRKIPEAVADFFIVCEADNSIQLKAISDNVEIEVKKNCKELPYKVEGRDSLQWIIIDYINIVVHIMLPESRKFYRLEELWSDAPATDYQKTNAVTSNILDITVSTTKSKAKPTKTTKK